MPRNLELKARIRFLSDSIRRAQNLPARQRFVIRQVDTYFNIPHGRLKLREMDGGTAELIFYMRANRTRARISDYSIAVVKNPAEIRRALKTVFGIRTVVKKKRTVFLYKNARIHIDQVRGLGAFLEFEVLVVHGREQARQLMNKLVRIFNVRRNEVLADSYADMLLRSVHHQRSAQ